MSRKTPQERKVKVFKHGGTIRVPLVSPRVLVSAPEAERTYRVAVLPPDSAFYRPFRGGVQSQRYGYDPIRAQGAFTGRELLAFRSEFGTAQPLRSLNINVSLHMTFQTDVLIETLQGLGATWQWAFCNIFSTQDHAAAGIARLALPLFSRGKERHYPNINGAPSKCSSCQVPTAATGLSTTAELCQIQSAP